MKHPSTVVFDLGNVFVRWNPRYFYRDHFETEEETEWFLAHICSPAWNADLDQGKPSAQAIAERIALHPEWEREIRLYDSAWEKMFAGVIEENVALLHDLKKRGVPVYALTNWSAEKFPRAKQLFPFFSLFDGAVVSGEVGLKKPEPEIYQALLKKFSLKAEDCFFTDDLLENVRTAETLGFVTHHFRDPKALRQALEAHGLA